MSKHNVHSERSNWKMRRKRWYQFIICDFGIFFDAYGEQYIYTRASRARESRKTPGISGSKKRKKEWNENETMAKSAYTSVLSHTRPIAHFIVLFSFFSLLTLSASSSSFSIFSAYYSFGADWATIRLSFSFKVLFL